MTFVLQFTSLTSSVQLNQVLVVLTVILASDFSSNQNKKNGSCLNYLSTNSLQEFGDT